MKSSKVLKGGAASVAALVAGGQAAVAADWSGFYGGVFSASTNSGTSPYQVSVYDDGYQIGGPSYGGFAGVRWDAGSAIIGLEAAISGPINADAMDDGASDPEDYMLNGLTDIKVSAGVEVGNALIYGFGGVSFGSGTGTSADDVYSTSGGNIGAGVDYRVSDKVSVGLEFIQRTMTGYTSGGNPENWKPMQSVSLRGSFHF
jgi:opacity protein-like surface antigen